MIKKRYAIVKVQEKCPAGWNLEPSFCCEKCEECKIADNYGDTKEQLIRKIAQVFSMEKIIVAKTLDEYKYKLAKEIVEFLGVE
jgi:hypothetical protein